MEQQIVKLTEKHICTPIERAGENIWQTVPDGYSFLFLSSQATEEDAERVCEFCTPDAEGQIMHWTEWKNYNGMGWLDTALESFHSLLRSKGITSPCAILEINN